MTKLDQFESVFKSANKAAYTYERLAYNHVLLVTDLEEADAALLVGQVRSFLSVIDKPETSWHAVSGDTYQNVRELLQLIEEHKPDLIVTYRHLHSSAWEWPYSLGEYLDVMTQATSVPVLVLPHPDADRALPHTLENSDRVMAITDHLTGDSKLVNVALALTSPGGTCWLTHVESQPVFERYMDAISKIPSIDTDTANEAVARQLLKEPRDFIAACRKTIEAEDVPVKIEEIVTMGRRVTEYQELIQERQIDLLVLYTMDEDQLAMNGRAYPLAVELRSVPLLML